jgi:hypothetical protein
MKKRYEYFLILFVIYLIVVIDLNFFPKPYWSLPTITLMHELGCDWGGEKEAKLLAFRMTSLYHFYSE